MTKYKGGITLGKKTNLRKRIAEKLIFFQQTLSIFIILMLVILVFVQVILRSLNLPLMGIEELLIFPTIWLYMLGAANASEERSHISVDILEVFLSNETVLTILDLAKNIISLLIGIVLLYWLFRHFSYSFTVWKLSPLLSMPMFFAESALFIGLLLMDLYTLSDVVTSVKNTKKYFANKKSEGGI